MVIRTGAVLHDVSKTSSLRDSGLGNRVSWRITAVKNWFANPESANWGGGKKKGRWCNTFREVNVNIWATDRKTVGRLK